MAADVAATTTAGTAATMTERSRGLSVVTIAGAVFCLLLIYLALQIRAGNDPSIGAGKQTTADAPRQVIVRRIIVRRVIEEDAPAGASTGASGASAPAPAAAQPTASSPAPSAPAAAPAPAPAPVVSAAS